MALQNAKTTSSGSKSKKGRWMTRAEAKTAARKHRRREERDLGWRPQPNEVFFKAIDPYLRGGDAS
jgi:hypothetical protein